MKKYNFTKTIFICTFLTFITIMGTIFTNKCVKDANKKILKNKLTIAAKNYVEKNNVAVSNEMYASADFLAQAGELASDAACLDYSYIKIQNDNGEYKYEPTLICNESESVQLSNISVLSGLVTDKQSASAVSLILNLEYSTTKITNKDVVVTIGSNYPIREIEKLQAEGWIVSNENKLITKKFSDNTTTPVTIELSAVNPNDGTIMYQTEMIDIQNIDKNLPIVSGVTDGQVTNNDITFTFEDGAVATLNGTPITSPYTVSDTNNYQLIVTDEATNKTVINFVVDKEKPVITLNGDSVITLFLGQNYFEFGATAKDNNDGENIAVTNITGNVDINTYGEYTISYNITDKAGNSADTVTRKVVVSKDVTIDMLNKQLQELKNKVTELTPNKDKYTSDSWNALEGATRLPETTEDEIRTKIEKIKESIDGLVKLPEMINMTFDTTNASKRYVKYGDTITLTFESNVELDLAQTVVSYTSRKLQATIVRDASVTDKYVYVATYTLDKNLSGTAVYNIDLVSINGETVTLSGNTPYRLDTTKPIINVTGNMTESVVVGEKFHDMAAITATDNFTASDKMSITTSILCDNGSTVIDTSEIGKCTITYNVTDLAGNSADAVVRTINVVEDSMLGELKIELDQLKEEMGKLNEQDYESNSWKNLQNALDLPDETKQEILDKISAINNAKDNLKLIPVIIGDKVFDTTNASKRYVKYGDTITLTFESNVELDLTQTVVSYTSKKLQATIVRDASVTDKYVYVATYTLDKNLNKTAVYSIDLVSMDGVKNTLSGNTPYKLDTTKPIINVEGNMTETVEKGQEFTDTAVITATDNLTASDKMSITTSISCDNGNTIIDTNVVGKCTIKYNVTDLAENSAEEVTRTINIIDKTALNELKDRVESLDQNDYTTDSWKKLQEALKLQETTTDEISDKISAIEDAISKLEPVELDRTKLNNIKKKLESLVETDYTTDSWENIQNLIGIAESQTLQSKLDEAISNIDLSTLVAKPVVKTALTELLNSLVESDYIDASWATFKQKANAVNDINDLQSNFDNALSELQAKYMPVAKDVNQDELEKFLSGLVSTDYENWAEFAAKANEVRNIIDLQSKFDKALEELKKFELKANKLNTEALEAIKNELATKNENDYTADSWKNIQDLIGIAENKTLQSELDKAVNAIDLNNLVAKPVDKTKLTELLNSLKESDYIADSWATFNEKANAVNNINDLQSRFDNAFNALKKKYMPVAKDVNQDELEKFLSGLVSTDYSNWSEFDAKANEVKNITDLQSKFDKALEELKKFELKANKLNTEALEAIKDELATKNEKDYTVDSWKNIQDLIDIAEKQTLQSELDKAVNNINLDNLVLIPKIITSSVTSNNILNQGYIKIGDTITLTFESNVELDLTQTVVLYTSRKLKATIVRDASVTDKYVYVATYTLDKNLNGKPKYNIDLVSIDGAKNTLSVNTPYTVDTTKPIINVEGNMTETVEKGQEFTDTAVITATDNYTASDKMSITTSISCDNGNTIIDTNVVGKCTIKYNVTDLAGNNAEEVTRTINIIDKTALNELKDRVESLDQNDYTTDSWNNLQDALKLPETTTDEINDKISAIENAISKLESVELDKTKLNNIKKELESLVETDYTTDSWENIQKLIGIAESQTLQSKLDEAVDNIDLDTLVVMPLNTNALESIKDAFNEKIESDYTDASWKNIQDLIDIAEGQTLQSELNKAVSNIDLSTLVAKPVDKTKLTELLNSLVESDYTADSWALFSKKANVTNNINDLQSRFDQTFKVLKEKYMPIAKTVVQTELDNLLSGLVPTDYENWLEFEAKANEVRNITDLQSKFDKALEELKAIKLQAKTINDTALKNILKGLVKDDYTSESWNTFETKVNEVKEQKLQSKFDAALKDLQENYMPVAKSVVQTELDNLLSGLVSTDYENWTEFETKANEVRNITDLQSKFDKALEELKGYELKVKTVDKTALTELLGSLKESDYTVDSWTLFSKQANEVNNINDLQSKFDAALRDLQENYMPVAKTVDQTELDKLLFGLVSTDYENWSEFETKANEVRNITDLQSNFDKALEELRAIKLQAKTIDDTALKNILNGLVKDDYTLESWNAFEAKVNEAKEQTLQSKFDAIVSTIDRNSLVLLPVINIKNFVTDNTSVMYTKLNDIVTLTFESNLKLDLSDTVLKINNTKVEITEENGIYIARYNVPGNYNGQLNYSIKPVALSSKTVGRVVTGQSDFIVDNEKPTIELIGDSVFNLKYGSIYNEQGLTIRDNFDSNVDVVTNGTIDANKIGEYIITYVATDDAGNIAEITRTIKVGATNANEIVRVNNNCQEDGTCYNTIDGNNYVWYSGYLWRVISVDNENRVKLITEESVSGFSYGSEDKASKFNESIAKDWLNNKFYYTLNNANKIVVTAPYCNETASSNSGLSRTTCSNESIVNSRVGLITIDEYSLLGGSRSFLNTGDYFFTMTPYSGYLLAVNQAGNGKIVSARNTFAIRPVITISNEVKFVSGEGTIDNPYRIEDDKSAESGTDLNNRYSGEYVQFAGKLWRIVSASGNGATKIVLDSLYEVNGDVQKVTYGIVNDFNLSSGIGYYLNNTLYNTFTDEEKNAMTMLTVYNSAYNQGDNPLKTSLYAGKNPKIRVYVGLNSVGELLSGNIPNSGINGVTSWLMNYNSFYKNGQQYTEAWYTTTDGASYFDDNGTIRGIKPLIALKSSIKIASGSGTSYDPYVLEY